MKTNLWNSRYGRVLIFTSLFWSRLAGPVIFGTSVFVTVQVIDGALPLLGLGKSTMPDDHGAAFFVCLGLSLLLLILRGLHTIGKNLETIAVALDGEGEINEH